MIGHGSPRTSRGILASTASAAAARCGWWFALMLSLALAPRGLSAAEMRVRLAWGGGAERLWSGTVSLSPQGTISQPRPLGIEADEPGSMWLQGGRLMTRQRTARAYDGVDLLLSAPLDSKLLVQLTAAGAAGQPIQVEIPLASLSGEFYERELDAQGNRPALLRLDGSSPLPAFYPDSLVACRQRTVPRGQHHFGQRTQETDNQEWPLPGKKRRQIALE